MEFLCQSSEDEMISIFLQSEIASSRYQSSILRALQKSHSSRSLIEEPDLGSYKENDLRRQIMDEYRGYSSNRELFENFPERVKWSWASLSPEELARVQYINYDYWLELSGGSRSVWDGAARIKQGVEIFGESNQAFLEAAKALKKGVKFPPLILVSTRKESKRVVLEGHLRLTAYFLEPRMIPEKIKVMIGYSPAFTNWDLY